MFIVAITYGFPSGLEMAWREYGKFLLIVSVTIRISVGKAVAHRVPSNSTEDDVKYMKLTNESDSKSYVQNRKSDYWKASSFWQQFQEIPVFSRVFLDSFHSFCKFQLC